MAISDINLIKAHTEFSPELITIERRLKTASFIAIMSLLVGGLLVGGTYFFLQARLESLKQEEHRLMDSLSRTSQKEGLYLSLKDRVSLVSKVVAQQISQADVLPILGRIAPPGQSVAGFSVDEKRSVSVGIVATSVEDLAASVTRVVEEAKSQHIRNPVLEGVTLTKEGAFRMALSFVISSSP